MAKPDAEPPEEEEEEESPEMARAMLAWERRNRIGCYYFLVPLFGVACMWAAWQVALEAGADDRRSNKLWFLAAFLGPAALWVTLVRLIISTMLLGEDELRTVEEDERQQRLVVMYLSMGGWADWVGVFIAIAHVAILWVLF